MNEHPFQIHNMPAVYVLETQMPQEMIDDVNEYMDEYRESKHKESLAKGKPVVNNNNSKGTEHKPYNFTSSEFKAMLDGYGNNLLKQYDLQRKAEKAEKKKEKPQQYQYIPASGYYTPAPQPRAGPKAYPPNQPRPIGTQQVSPDQAYMDELFNVGGL